MSSDKKDSWKTILKNEGYKVTSVLKGMGEYKFIREMFMDKLKDVYICRGTIQYVTKKRKKERFLI